jgi:hypothetical protein
VVVSGLGTCHTRPRASSLSPRATKARAKSSRYVTVAEYLSGLTLDGSGEDAVAHGGAPHHLP